MRKIMRSLIMYSRVISCLRKNRNILKEKASDTILSDISTPPPFFAISPPRVVKTTHYGQERWLMAKYVLVTRKSKIHLKYSNFSYFTHMTILITCAYNKCKESKTER
jgi:hypothetical protein